MKTITRDEIEQHPEYRHSHETSHDPVPSLVSKRLMTVAVRSTEETCACIVRALATAEWPLTRAQICKRIARKKAPGVIAIIESMVADGTLERSQSTMPNGVVVFYYELGA